MKTIKIGDVEVPEEVVFLDKRYYFAGKIIKIQVEGTPEKQVFVGYIFTQMLSGYNRVWASQPQYIENEKYISADKFEKLKSFV